MSVHGRHCMEFYVQYSAIILKEEGVVGLTLQMRRPSNLHKVIWSLSG